MKRKIIIPVMILALTAALLTSCGQFQAKMQVKEGNDLYSAKKYEEAIQKYKSALSKAPNLYLIYLNLGLSYMAL
jgi:tetratricopeptide (TPR) repeat protein